MRKCFEVQNSADGESAEILIYDRIGRESGSGISAQDVSNALRDILPAKQILVRINSPGGNLWDGMAIYNMLAERKQYVRCQIDGIAASSASLIAIAGRETVMPESGLFMIHMPKISAFGDAQELRRDAEKLDRHTTSLTLAYGRKSGRSEAAILEKMQCETWFDSAGALAFGLVDRITEPGGTVTAMASDFDFTGFKNVPTDLTTRGEALLYNWGFQNPNQETYAQRWTRFYGNT